LPAGHVALSGLLFLAGGVLLLTAFRDPEEADI
jgi:hypothetical protein